MSINTGDSRIPAPLAVRREQLKDMQRVGICVTTKLTSGYLLSGCHFSREGYGLGGTVKCLAARASLQRPYDEQIMTPLQLDEWAIRSVDFVLLSKRKSCPRESISEKLHPRN